MIRTEINDSQVANDLRRLASAMDDMSKPLGDIGAAMVRSSKDRIDQGVTPEGGRFAPRSQTTLDHYARSKPPVTPAGGPLKLRGDMQSGIFYQAGPTAVEIGSNAIQAAVMQFGAAQGQFGAFIGKDRLGRDHFHSIPWGNIPARPFLGVSDDDRTTIGQIVEEWLSGVIDAAD